MPIIEVSLLAGRSAEVKSALVRDLTDVTERTLGVKRESIRVLLREVPPEHWAVGGRTMDQIAAAVTEDER
jgi:4-oxalocrotonate tautomerase